MSAPAEGFDDAATLDIAGKATDAGVKWLLANRDAWKSQHYLGRVELTRQMVLELSSICRTFAARDSDLNAELFARSRRLGAAIYELEAEENFAAASTGTVAGEIPRGLTPSEWAHRCKDAAAVLKILRQQIEGRSRRWNGVAKGKAAEGELYFALFTYFADLCFVQVDDLTISAADGPRAHAMNFILVVVDELLGRQPSPGVVSRSIGRRRQRLRQKG